MLRAVLTRSNIRRTASSISGSVPLSVAFGLSSMIPVRTSSQSPDLVSSAAALGITGVTRAWPEGLCANPAGRKSG